MPKYRALYTKIIDSFDFNDMPDDFVRLTWVMLPLILDCEGRGIDSPMWIRAKMYPLRNGVIDSEIRRAFDWFVEHEMIIRYEVKGRLYFYIPTWKQYQKGTQKEAASVLPEPPEVRSKSGVSPEKVDAAVYESAYESEYAFASEYEPEPETEMSSIFSQVSGIMPYNPDKWIESCQSMVRNKVTRETLQRAIDILRDKRYSISGPWSVEKTAIGLVSENTEHERREPLQVDENGRVL
jgi:hypothetical protein